MDTPEYMFKFICPFNDVAGACDDDDEEDDW